MRKISAYDVGVRTGGSSVWHSNWRRRRPDNSPKVGEMAPDFVVKPGGRGGAAVNLKDYQGKQNVLIEFFPGAFTPGMHPGIHG